MWNIELRIAAPVKGNKVNKQHAKRMAQISKHLKNFKIAINKLA
jgi:hypothetical protein